MDKKELKDSALNQLNLILSFFSKVEFKSSWPSPQNFDTNLV